MDDHQLYLEQDDLIIPSGIQPQTDPSTDPILTVIQNTAVFGTLLGTVCGAEIDKETVGAFDMVVLRKDPLDGNMLQVVKMIDSVTVGHLEQGLATAITAVLDSGIAEISGVLHKTQTGITVELILSGLLERKAETVCTLSLFGLHLKESSADTGEHPTYDQPVLPSTSTDTPSTNPEIVYLHNEQNTTYLDQLFENLKEDDQTAEMEPAKAIRTRLYRHQKQALSWMVKRENEDDLPPFWKVKRRIYINTLSQEYSDVPPASIRGGILADDMGLGKTLTVIALVLTNFKNNQPLAVPVEGYIRKSKSEQKMNQFKRRPAKRDPRLQCGMKMKRAITAASPSCSSEDTNFTIISNNSADSVIEVTDDSTDEDLASISLDSRGKNYGTNGSAILAFQNGTELGSESFPIQVDGETSGLELDTSSDRSNDGSVHNKRAVKRLLSYKDVDEPNMGPASDVSPIKRVARDMISVASDSPSVASNVWTDDSNPFLVASDSPLVASSLSSLASDSPLVASNLPSVNSDLATGDSDMSAVASDLSEGSPSTHAVAGQTQDPAADVHESDEAAEAHVMGSGDGSHYLQQCIESSTPIQHASPKRLHFKNLTPCRPTKPRSDDDTLPDLSPETEDPLSPEIITLTPEPEVTAGPRAPHKAHKVTASPRAPRKAHEVAEGPRGTLIVCPLSVMSQWKDQFEEHVDKSVELKILQFHSSSRTTDHTLLAKQDIVLTTYGTVSADAKGNGILREVEWLRLVLDEGHTIRNPHAKQTIAIRELNAQRKWILTGTPIQNYMKDLYSLVKFLEIKPLDDHSWWTCMVERPMKSGEKQAFKRVRRLLSTVAMRRVKTDMVNGEPLIQLPERTVCMEKVVMEPEQRQHYDLMENEGKIIISRLYKQGKLLRYYTRVLAILVRLRQFCCHPRLVASAMKSANNPAGGDQNPLDQNIDQADSDEGQLRKQLMAVLNSGSHEECSICLDDLKDPVVTQCVHVFCRVCIDEVIERSQPNASCPMCREPITRDTLNEVAELQDASDETPEDSEHSWESSSKVDALMINLQNLRKDNPSIKSLVVSQFTAFLSLLETHLQQQDFNFTRYNGKMSATQRNFAVKTFQDQSDGSPTIMLLSLKAGGVGLNLTAASRVFLLDPAWNPASEEQCFDRCHRLGQNKDVIITKFVVQNSVEERMLELQEKKRRLMQGAFSKQQTPEDRISDLRVLMPDLDS